jgi:hypothetical protein
LIPDRARNISLHSIQTGSGSTQHHVQLVPGALSVVVKWQEHEADHSCPSVAEVKHVWSHTSTPPYDFMLWHLIKHRTTLFYMGTVLLHEGGIYTSDLFIYDLFNNASTVQDDIMSDNRMISEFGRTWRDEVVA